MLCSFLLALAVFIGSTAFSLYGFRLRSRFQCGEECDMTYSRFHFVDLEIAHKISSFDYPYKLFKFTDRRDPRYSHLWEDHTKNNNRQDEGVKTKRWCQAHGARAAVGHPVLYVPGHGGTHNQARSLG